MPADGDRQGLNLLGVPLMMEYDTPTRSWKLLVDTELDTVIVVSGTVSLEAGDLEIGAVEIKDATTEQRAIVNALGQLHVFITGSALGAVDTELPPAIAAGDAMANPVAPQVLSNLLAFNGTGWDRVRIDSGFQLQVTLISGAFPADASVDTELPAAIPLTNNMANPTAPQVIAHTMFFDEDANNWDQAHNDAGRNLRVTLISGAFPAGETLPVSLDSLPNLVATEDEVTAYVTGTVHAIIDTGDIEIGAVEIKDAVTDDRQRVTADGRAWVNALITGTVAVDTELDAGVVLSEGMGNPTPPAVGSFNMGYNGADWDRLIVDSERRLETRAFVTGSVTIDGTVDTELPAAVVLSDGMGNPTPPAVGSFLMGWNGADWDRIGVDPGDNIFTTLISGAFPAGETLPVSLASMPDLVKTEDEVTAYVTGSVSLVVDPTILRDIINITGSAAAEYMLVTGIAGQQLRVMETMLISSNLQNVRFQSGWSGTALTGPLHLANSGDGFYVGSPDGVELYHFETESGQMLILDTDAGGQIGGWIIYYYE